MLLGLVRPEKRSSTSSTRSPPRRTARNGRPFISEGAAGLRAKVDEVAARTDGMLEYIGEWHSHPEALLDRPEQRRPPGLLLAHRV